MDVAHVTQCPYCIKGHTKLASCAGATDEEIMEAIWVAAEMRAGGADAYSTLAASAVLILGLAACVAEEQPSEASPSEAASAEATAADAAEGGADEGSSEGAADESSDGQPAEAAAEGECVAQEGSSEIPTTTPKVDEWVMVGNVAIPTSETYGPYVQEDDLWTCYEHSAEGALFASAYIFRASSNVEGFAEEWFPEGEIRELAAESEGQSSGMEDDGDSVTIVGYRFQTYSEASALIDLVAEYGIKEGTALVSLRVAVMWEADRWMVDLENFGEEAMVVDSLDGYTSWRG